jgi:hypothetical protein
MSKLKYKLKKWLRKRHLKERYGDCSDRTIERMVIDGRLPRPEYPFHNRIPAWQEEVLDEHERAAVMAPRPAKPDCEIKRNNAEAGKGVASKSKHRAEVTIAQS